MNPYTDEVLEGLRPRMQTARVAHVRRVVAGLAMVPLIGFGAVAMAADGADEPAIETADGAPVDDATIPAADLPDIGTAGDEVDRSTDDGEDVDDNAGVSDADEVPEEDPEEQIKVLSLGLLGSAEVAETDGGLELLHADLVEGWEVVEIDVTDDGIVIIIKKGDSLKVVTITDGVRDEIDVKVEDLRFPTTTTTTTTTTAKPEPPEVVTDRFTVTVEGKGSFIVEREGETLWVGNVTTNEGYDHEVVKGEGWKVYVKFTNGEWNWFGKALINDNGEVEQHFWDEEPPFEPIYQWVPVPEVGAVKFTLGGDGLVHVKEWELAEGYGFWDYNEGSPAEVAKIDFEGEGSLWIVEAWGNEDGGISYSVDNASPE
jgi:hypothetical protein